MIGLNKIRHIDRLTYFYHVVNEGGISKAAREVSEAREELSDENTLYPYQKNFKLYPRESEEPCIWQRFVPVAFPQHSQSVTPSKRKVDRRYLDLHFFTFLNPSKREA